MDGEVPIRLPNWQALMSIPDNPWLEGFHFEVHCPGNGYSMNYIWKEAVEEQSLPDETSLQLGYPYGKPKPAPTASHPHSILAGDYLITENGEIILTDRR